MSGMSHIYGRLLRGQVTPERYVAVLKRSVEMRFPELAFWRTPAASDSTGDSGGREADQGKERAS